MDNRDPIHPLLYRGKFIPERKSGRKRNIQYIVFSLDPYPNYLYIRHKMKMRRCSEQIMDEKRRAMLVKSASLLGAIFANLGLPSLCSATCRLIFPMPERPPISSGLQKSIPKAALIIDDIGNSISIAEAFLNLNLPITFSVLPLRPFSRELVDEITSMGHEVLLHQPMEPFSPDIDPGPGAVYTHFTATQIRDTIKRNIDHIAAAVGINNHMGSKFTADSEKMAEALSAMKDDGLFFIDSLTSHRSVGYKVAKKLHIRTAHRNVFLDCAIKMEATIWQMRRLMCLAIGKGKAIGIGHPFPSTLEGIRRFLAAEGKLLEMVQFVSASKLIETEEC